MILPNAPAVLMFSFDEPLSIQDQERLSYLNATGPLSKDEDAEKNALEEKKSASSMTKIASWLPIPVDTKITPFASKSYQTVATKTIQLDSFTRTIASSSTINSVTLTFTSPSGLFINSLLFALDFMFQMDSTIPSIRYFSDELIIIKGYLISYTHDVDTVSNQHTIKIEVQKQLWLQNSTTKFTTKIEAKPIALKTAK